jgi:hypothetical protein
LIQVEKNLKGPKDIFCPGLDGIKDGKPVYSLNRLALIYFQELGKQYDQIIINKFLAYNPVNTYRWLNVATQ